ncbi:hypothetical protein MHY87_14565 [Microvirga sp. ACRRW]|uniref:hypothetical protein n=1 Tax=Microvirga sp. ACRRW TaxID=2918205 RepID=UPI001EF744E0|nr:hypothetical protein [Microvirga sp. ACRRW]MCG7394129.1 hypothetical protein [Microvirga sp. ACRRW]
MENKTPRSIKSGILLYAMALAFIAFELFILALTRYPQVSEEYRAYYITHTAPCPPLRRGRSYKLGTTVSLTSAADPSARNYLACNWSKANEEGTWTEKSYSKIYMSLRPPEGDLIMKLGILGFAGERNNQEIEVSVNGTVLTTWTLPTRQSGEAELTIPQAVASDGNLQVQFRTLHPSVLAGSGLSGSSNQVGMLVKWFLIDKAAR